MVYVSDIKYYVNEECPYERTVYAVKKGAIEVQEVINDCDIEVNVAKGTETIEHAKAGELVAIMLNDDYSRYLVNDKADKYNMWIITPDVLKDKYEIFETNSDTVPIKNLAKPRIYVPKGGEQKFLQLNNDIEFTAPWGEKQTIYSGGYLNITDMNDIYGINEDEFKETYLLC